MEGLTDSGMLRLQAETQYGDLKGTVAADEFGAGQNSFEELFEATGKVDTDNEVLIAFEFYAGEGYFFLRGYYHPKSESSNLGWVPSLNHDFQNQSVPIVVKKVDVNITLVEFFKHFKRFNVVLACRGLDVIGRDYDLSNE